MSATVDSMTPTPDALVEALRPCTLAECPPGPFLFDGGHLGFKTEYGAALGKDVGGGRVEWTISNHADPYVMASGEVFWGGAKGHIERDALIVQPIDPDELLAAHNRRPTPPADLEGVRKALEALVGRARAWRKVLGLLDPTRVLAYSQAMHDFKGDVDRAVASAERALATIQAAGGAK